MRNAWVIVSIMLLVVVGLLLFPTAHIIIDAVDTTGQLPLVTSSIKLLPYAFLTFIVYAINRITKE